MTETKTFAELGVEDDLAEALTDLGITAPFPIQELTLPLALSGADVIGQARTGTGKTLAFGLPLLQRVQPARRRLRRRSTPVQALVVVPTRELCLQVRDDLAQASSRRDMEIVAAYGGRAIEPQIDALRQGAPVVVGTPGRLLDLTNRGALDLSGVITLVLDEADEMLDLGFLPDVERIIQQTADERQTMLFSATMPAPVVGLARRYMRKPTFLRADVEEVRIAPETRQHFFSCHRLDKPAVLARILQAPSRGLCVVFVRTKRMADILASDLRDRGIAGAPIHSDLRQDARERALLRFRQGKIDVLVATEVAARGLDIDDVTHVVNYDCPDDEKMYLHRIGRTGRAGAAGVAITLAVWNELARLEMIKRALDITDETHEVFSTSPILDELFDLPPREAERVAPSTEDWQRAVRRGEREIRQGDDDRGPARQRDDRGPARQRDDEQRGDRRPARQRDDEQRGEGGRVRQRTRRRTARAQAGQDESTAAPATGASAEPQGAESGAGTRRVRRRVRVTAPAGGAADATAEAPAERDTAKRRGSGPKDSGPKKETSAARDGGRRSSRNRRRGGSGGSGSRGKRSSGSGSDAAQRGSGSRGGAAQRGSGSRGRSGGSAGNNQRSRGTGTAVDLETARDGGRPRLRRPLEVSYLP